MRDKSELRKQVAAEIRVLLRQAAGKAKANDLRVAIHDSTEDTVYFDGKCQIDITFQETL